MRTKTYVQSKVKLCPRRNIHSGYRSRLSFQKAHIRARIYRCCLKNGNLAFIQVQIKQALQARDKTDATHERPVDRSNWPGQLERN